MMKPGVRLNVFAIRRVGEEGAVWTRAGVACINRDGSMTLRLDVLPLSGELHVRETSENPDFVGAATQRAPESSTSTTTTNAPSLEAAEATASMGGH